MEISRFEDFPEVNYKKKQSKVDSKRWCRKVGREHVFVYKPYYSFMSLLCKSCNISIYRVDRKVQARYNPKLAKQLELETVWCAEGHLYDWVIVEDECWNYRSALYRRRMCLMCGKVSKSKFLGYNKE